MTIYYRVGQDMLAADRWTTVPLDWADPDGPTIDVYARELVDARSAAQARDLPALIYLQGGPGGKSPRPLVRGHFFGTVLERFRVVLLDQRGTGRSTPIQGAHIGAMTGADAGRYLSHFLADSIIKDAEAIRATHYEGEPWWSVGQSYGGFLTLHYLSVAPEALVACIITGGTPSLNPDPAQVYRRTYPRVRAKNAEFFARLPHLRGRVDRIADVLASRPVMLPDGDRLTVRRFQTLGLHLGVSVGYDQLQWLLDEAFTDSSETELTEAFISAVGRDTSYSGNPLFMALQESIYGAGASGWAAQAELANHPDFAEDARPLLFTGEMAFPWMMEEIAALRPYAAGVAELAKGRWPIDLYDTERLAVNSVPVEAAVYYDEMFCDAELSLETATRVGEYHAWVTNEFDHDGIRSGDVVAKLCDRLDIRLAERVRLNDRLVTLGNHA